MWYPLPILPREHTNRAFPTTGKRADSWGRTSHSEREVQVTSRTAPEHQEEEPCSTPPCHNPNGSARGRVTWNEGIKQGKPPLQPLPALAHSDCPHTPGGGRWVWGEVEGCVRRRHLSLDLPEQALSVDKIFTKGLIKSSPRKHTQRKHLKAQDFLNVFACL